MKNRSTIAICATIFLTGLLVIGYIEVTRGQDWRSERIRELSGVVSTEKTVRRNAESELNTALQAGNMSDAQDAFKRINQLNDDILKWQSELDRLGGKTDFPSKAEWNNYRVNLQAKYPSLAK